jgi:hypothetical protein
MNSETVRKWILTLSFATLSLVALFHMVTGLVPNARAQQASGGRTMVCQNDVTRSKTASWMNEQLQAGKGDFISLGDMVCAW